MAGIEVNLRNQVDFLWVANRVSDWALKPVVAISENRVSSLVHLRIGGDRLQTTAEHPFLTRRGWVVAGELVVGDEVRRSDGQWVAVSRVEVEEHLAVPVRVYNIEVADWHTYLVGKWLWVVHNAEVCIYEALKKLKELAKTHIKPPHSPDFKKWLSKGGSIEILEKDGTYIYKRADGVKVKYKDGYPVFEPPHLKQEVKIPDMKGNHTTDYTEADKLAPKGPRKKGNTWHHHQDGKRMQEVSRDVHKDFTHVGGVSGTKKAKGVKLKKKKMISIEPNGTLTNSDIAALEREIGFSLPDDYSKFLRFNNGGQINNQVFYVDELEQDILMDVFFGFNLENDKVLTITFWLEKYRDEMPENSLLIGSDPGGAFILYIVDGEDSGIYYYDDSYFFEQSSEEQNTYYLAETFQEFIDSLKDFKE